MSESFGTRGTKVFCRNPSSIRERREPQQWVGGTHATGPFRIPSTTLRTLAIFRDPRFPADTSTTGAASALRRKKGCRLSGRRHNSRHPDAHLRPVRRALPRQVVLHIGPVSVCECVFRPRRAANDEFACWHSLGLSADSSGYAPTGPHDRRG